MGLSRGDAGLDSTHHSALERPDGTADEEEEPAPGWTVGWPPVLGKATVGGTGDEGTVRREASGWAEETRRLPLGFSKTFLSSIFIV